MVAKVEAVMVAGNMDVEAVHAMLIKINFRISGRHNEGRQVGQVQGQGSGSVNGGDKGGRNGTRFGCNYYQ